MTERMVRVNGVDLCVEAFGDPRDPVVLLIQGVGASMLWWDERFCRSLAERGRRVIRYDARDTGRSVVYEPGRPGYTGGDLVADAAGVLDALGAERSPGLASSCSTAPATASTAPTGPSSSTPPSTSAAPERSRRRLAHPPRLCRHRVGLRRAGSGEPVVDTARTAQEIVEHEAATTDLPELVALPDDEWRALLETDLVEAELIRCGA